jgi:aryl-alcohol dehydrogenase-like predicted oxidoreductase
VAEKIGFAPPSAVQLPYNVLYRRAVEDSAMQEVCEACGVSIVASYGLYGGLLTNKYAEGAAGPRDRLDEGQLARLEQRGLTARVEALAQLARELSITPAQLALAYCLEGPNVASVVFGAKSRAQVEENLGASRAWARLDDEILARMRDISS